MFRFCVCVFFCAIFLFFSFQFAENPHVNYAFSLVCSFGRTSSPIDHLFFMFNVLWFMCYILLQMSTYVVINVLVFVTTQFMYTYSWRRNWLIISIIKVVTIVWAEIVSCILVLLEYWIGKCGTTQRSWCKDDELKQLKGDKYIID